MTQTAPSHLPDPQTRAPASAESHALSRSVRLLQRVLSALEATDDGLRGVEGVLEAVRDAFGWRSAGYWELDDASQRLRVAVCLDGDLLEASASAQLAAGEGLVGHAWAQGELIVAQDLPLHRDCPRTRAAERAGATQGLAVPLFLDSVLLGVLDFFADGDAEFSDARRETLGAMARIVAARLDLLRRRREHGETAIAASAFRSLRERLVAADSREAVLQATLDSVRDTFGWAYGSFWHLDAEENVLRFGAESGTVSPDFVEASHAAHFAKGVGVAGRVWATNKLVCVEDLTHVNDCVRAPPPAPPASRVE